ncbi:MAG: DNA mismatch repair protein MutS [Oscillospiraceae bacterium]|nr:DNA mismatch repair protein MutS [Oscillospiraceae bacterium]
MWFNRQKKQMRENYGKKPDIHYFDGDMRGIKSYFNYREQNDLDEFLVDDTTWNDLAGDEIFKRINQGLSTSGEQYLYYLLRSPTLHKSEYEKRAKLIEIMEKDPELRLKLQIILMQLGRSRQANTTEVFSPAAHGLRQMFIYIALVISLITSAVSLIFTFAFVPLLVVLFVFIPVYHNIMASRNSRELATVNYSVAMVYAAKKINKLSYQGFTEYHRTMREAMKRLKPILRLGFIPSKNSLGEIAELINSFILLDLIGFELMKNLLGKHHADIFHIHEQLGQLDSAIAVASYRKNLGNYAIPEISFNIAPKEETPASAGSKIHIVGTALIHPLVEGAVPNDFDITSSVLLTGSNASGKSTFLKTVVINAIFAQSICTVLGESFTASAFRIYSSMAITDNILAGESYFISEIKSLKRIVEADSSKQPLLCVIDEVLRGTNTVERIAASSELLRHLSDKNAICLAATHDIELTSLLESNYKMLHFEETVTDDGEVLFDYLLKGGPATTRNAIKLLAGMGFDKKLVKRADERANLYTQEGRW